MTKKKNSAWSRHSSRRKQTTIDQGLVSSSAQAQLHQAPLNGLENDLIYQVTCTYNICLLNGCAAWVREMREQGMMRRRERTLISHPSLHLSLHTSFDFLMGKKELQCAAFYSCINTPFSIGGLVSPWRRKKSVFRVQNTLVLESFFA